MDRMIIATKLVELRGDQSRQDVAIKLKISKRAIDAYETGYRIPTDEIKIKLAAIYGVKVGYLFYDE